MNIFDNMRKLTVFTLLVLAGVPVSAQTVYDALTMSRSDYFGTARSMALGNAVTALGGDLGSVTLNPAGAAVSSYSQFVITPGYAASHTTGAFTAGVDKTSKTNSVSDIFLPNIGLNLVFDAYSGYRLKSWSFGFVTNATALHLGTLKAGGRNSDSSFMGAMADGAHPYSPSSMAGDYFSSSVPWNYIVGNNSGLISHFGADHPDPPYTYVAATEKIVEQPDGRYVRYVAGDLNQSYRRQTSGVKKDFIMNFAANFYDVFYLGLNIGMPNLSYSYDEYMKETAVNPADFTYELDGRMASFSSGSYQYSYSSSVSGIYAKIGCIWRPTSSVRLGAAVQTPTAYTIEEHWAVAGSTSYTDRSFNASADSPQSDFAYYLRSPFRANFGAAVTLGNLGLVSVDYELCDYSTMKYSAINDGYYVDFSATNAANSLFTGRSNLFRAGAEFRLGKAVALRAGYTFTTCPEYTYIDNEGLFVDASEYLAYYDDFLVGRYTLETRNRVKNDSSSFSFGIGYSSKGSFFCDAAVRVINSESFSLRMYDDYVQDVQSPVIDAKNSITTALLTLGWRF